jgi:hypothetical protein
MSFFDKHVFICCNQRAAGEDCCNNHGSSELLGYMKDRVKAWVWRVMARSVSTRPAVLGVAMMAR